MKTHTTDREADFSLVHVCNAPRSLVFKAFSNADALNEWWGPVETNNSVISLDFRPGGIFHFSMEAGGHVSYGRFLFHQIIPDELLEFTNAFADEKAQVVKPPFDLDFPLEIFYRIVFTEEKGKTTLTLTGYPVDATPEEAAGFRSIRGSMDQGFSATFGQLSRFLEKQGI
ncbi:SRPBCC family protein [Chitinophaga solisilvae]|uniref:SRPBCC domain-containing protein n=1 Tax=Chitinophaga solisilvae TaxID=1233460 RepID=A0A433WFI7_9BACT|nr:SRPBCC domain-containing protein [Chitinophaga solisilvae]NSL85578.1 SRPBCC domain-containing protein [Chitinophaga solisilvae]